MTEKTTSSISYQLSLFENEGGNSEIDKKNKATILQHLRFLISKKLLDGTTLQDYKRVDEIGIVTKNYHEDEENLPSKNHKAIKEVKFSLKQEELFFLKEVKKLVEVNHDNVIKIEKVFFLKEDNGPVCAYLVMPWIDHTFISWMLGTEHQTGTMHDIPNNIRSFEEVRNVFFSTLQGINAIHSKFILHADIRFENILVREVQQVEEGLLLENKPKFEAVIADFGKILSLLKLASISGYKPPEFCDFLKRRGELTNSKTNQDLEKENENSIDKSDFFTPKADIYSFGVMLYKIFIQEKDGIDKTKINKQTIKERISKIFPKDKDNISETIIDDIEDILLICLENAASNRPQAANLLLEHPFFNPTLSKCPKQHLKIQRPVSNLLEIQKSITVQSVNSEAGSSIQKITCHPFKEFDPDEIFKIAQTPRVPDLSTQEKMDKGVEKWTEFWNSLESVLFTLLVPDYQKSGTDQPGGRIDPTILEYYMQKAGATRTVVTQSRRGKRQVIVQYTLDEKLPFFVENVKQRASKTWINIAPMTMVPSYIVRKFKHLVLKQNYVTELVEFDFNSIAERYDFSSKKWVGTM